MKHTAASNIWKEYPRVPSLQSKYLKQGLQTPQRARAHNYAAVFTLIVILFLVISMTALGKMSGVATLSSPAAPSFIVRGVQKQNNLRVASSPPPAPMPVSALIEKLFLIGTENATGLVDILASNDPFGVNEIRDARDFVCPSDLTQRIDFPSLVDDTNAELFRNNDPDAFIFYQHLRKAGGTGFCDMANSNLPRGSVPGYYCMPDQRGSLATPPWNDAAYLTEKMHARGWKIAANEWDVYYDKHGQIPGAVLATTFRHPIDRWYSQYRFEHLEHRDGSAADSQRQSFFDYYKGMMGWSMNYNYYVATFIGQEDPRPPANKGDFYWTYRKYWKKSITLQQFLKSLENVRRFNLLLVTEYLDYSAPLIDRVLGWKVPPKQVLPHEVQALRSVKKNIPASARMAPDKYAIVCQENVFDLLLFDIVKRIYLERLVCGSETGANAGNKEKGAVGA